MIRLLITVAIIAIAVRDPKPVTFFEAFALLGLLALLEIADEIRDLRKAQAPAELLVCDAELADMFTDGASLWCARRLGHRGPHSTSRHPHAGSTTWRTARRKASR